jgi:hypothetical protein
MRAELAASTSGPPTYPPPPPPLPPREFHLALDEDLGNLPGRRAPLPSAITFRGETIRDREQMKVLLGYARFVRHVPGSIFTDPIANLQDLLKRARGEPRKPSPASSTRVPRSRSGAVESPRSRPQSRASTRRGQSPQRRSRSPLQRNPPSDGPVLDRVRRLEHRVDEIARELREGVRRNEEALQRLEEFLRKKTVRRSSLQNRAAPPRLPGSSGAPIRAGEIFELRKDEFSPEGKMLSL